MPVGCMLGAQTPDLISKKQGLIYRYTSNLTKMKLISERSFPAGCCYTSEASK